MTNNSNTATSYDVIIVGGSYAGLSAAMSLGRALRDVLVIDSGDPCNRQTPHSHNFITHDGETPAAIAEKARQQVLQYPTVRFVNGIASSAERVDSGFKVNVEGGATFTAKKLLFATGMRDVLPSIPGLAECWGISVLHCPYCHGYEVRNRPTGIIANGDMAFELAKLIQHWTKRLTLFTNGSATLTEDQLKTIRAHNIPVIETEIDSIDHDGGHLNAIRLRDGSVVGLEAVYARPSLVQHCDIPATLGCELTEQNLVKVDAFQRTTVPGIFAAGDNTIMMRAVSMAVASGGFAGASINKELIDESFRTDRIASLLPSPPERGRG